ncbi:MAG TPA: tol-pal system protein YbgF [Nitrospira sp.]|nr:tol-pal system protein YbgF [Nitrospira sp.]
MARSYSRLLGSVLFASVLLGHLVVAPSLHATPAQSPDASRRLYDRVMEEFRHKDYNAALAGFRFFLELHGQSALSANAQYWMGECHYRLGHFKDALDAFYNVISYYPLSQKLAAATLKIGQIYGRQGDREKAQMMYERVTDQYPDSAEAEVARKALDGAVAKTEPAATEPG